MPQDARQARGARPADVLTDTDAVVRELPPYAVIVARVPDGQQDNLFAALAARMLKLGRSDVTIIAVTPDASLDTLSEDEMRAAGWVRAPQ